MPLECQQRAACRIVLPHNMLADGKPVPFHRSAADYVIRNTPRQIPRKRHQYELLAEWAEATEGRNYTIMFTDIDIACRFAFFCLFLLHSVKPTAWVKLVMQFLALRSGPTLKYQVADKIYTPVILHIDLSQSIYRLIDTSRRVSLRSEILFPYRAAIFACLPSEWLLCLVRDFRLLPRCQWNLRSPGMLHSVNRQLPTFRDNLTDPSTMVLDC